MRTRDTGKYKSGEGGRGARFEKLPVGAVLTTWEAGSVYTLNLNIMQYTFVTNLLNLLKKLKKNSGHFWHGRKNKKNPDVS